MNKSLTNSSFDLTESELMFKSLMGLNEPRVDLVQHFVSQEQDDDDFSFLSCQQNEIFKLLEETNNEDPENTFLLESEFKKQTASEISLRDFSLS